MKKTREAKLTAKAADVKKGAGKGAAKMPARGPVSKGSKQGGLR